MTDAKIMKPDPGFFGFGSFAFIIFLVLILLVFGLPFFGGFYGA